MKGGNLWGRSWGGGKGSREQGDPGLGNHLEEPDLGSSKKLLEGCTTKGLRGGELKERNRFSGVGKGWVDQNVVDRTGRFCDGERNGARDRKKRDL